MRSLSPLRPVIAPPGRGAQRGESSPTPGAGNQVTGDGRAAPLPLRGGGPAAGSREAQGRETLQKPELAKLSQEAGSTKPSLGSRFPFSPLDPGWG